MLKTILLLFLIIQIAFCASLARNLYDQYITLPKREVNCSELRKQFADGYIQLKEFIDRIRTCKEDSRVSSQNAKSGISETTTAADKKSSLLTNSKYTYTDYLVPVLRTTYNQAPISASLSSYSNPSLPSSSRSSVSMKYYPNNPTQTVKYIQSGFSYPQGYNPLIKDYTNFSSVKYPLQRTNNVNYQLPTAYSYYGYQNPTYRYLSNTAPVKYFNGVQSFQPLTNARENIQQSQVQSPVSFSPPTWRYATTTNNNNQYLEAQNPGLGNDAGSWSEYFQYRNMLNNLGYNREKAFRKSTLSNAVPLLRTANYRGNSPTPQIGSKNIHDGNAQEISRYNNIPKSGSNTQYLSRTEIMKNELKQIDLELKDDVSMLSETSGGKNQLSLKDYESLAPKIIENIAARSKIDLHRKFNTRIHTTKKSNLTNNKPSSNISTSMVKDILDIKYSQLEDKLLNDIRRRQAVLQKLEQEALAERYAHKNKPTPMPVASLGEVFKSMSDEQISQKIFQNETESSNVLADDYPQDNMGFFQDSKIPTRKRSAPDNPGFQAAVNDQNNNQVIKQSRDDDKRIKNSFIPHDMFGESNEHVMMSRDETAPVENKIEGREEESNEPDLKGYVNIGPISPDGYLNVENVEGARNELSSNQMKSYINPAVLLSNQVEKAEPRTQYRPPDNAVFQNNNDQEVRNNIILMNRGQPPVDNIYLNNEAQRKTDLSDFKNSAGINPVTSQFLNNNQLNNNENLYNLQNSYLREQSHNPEDLANGETSEKNRIYTRSILFTNSFYKAVIRAAMKKKSRSTVENDSESTMNKKSVISGTNERKKRWFNINKLDFGLNNGNTVD